MCFNWCSVCLFYLVFGFGLVGVVGLWVGWLVCDWLALLTCWFVFIVSLCVCVITRVCCLVWWLVLFIVCVDGFSWFVGL